MHKPGSIIWNDLPEKFAGPRQRTVQGVYAIYDCPHQLFLCSVRRLRQSTDKGSVESYRHVGFLCVSIYCNQVVRRGSRKDVGHSRKIRFDKYLDISGRQAYRFVVRQGQYASAPLHRGVPQEVSSMKIRIFANWSKLAALAGMSRRSKSIVAFASSTLPVRSRSSA